MKTLHDAAQFDMTVPDGEDTAPCDTFIMPHGGRRTIYDQARHALRLSPADASWLFGTSRAKDEVTGALRRIADGKPPRDAAPPPVARPAVARESAARKNSAPAGPVSRRQPAAR